MAHWLINQSLSYAITGSGNRSAIVSIRHSSCQSSAIGPPLYLYLLSKECQLILWLMLLINWLFSCIYLIKCLRHVLTRLQTHTSLCLNHDISNSNNYKVFIWAFPSYPPHKLWLWPAWSSFSQFLLFSKKYHCCYVNVAGRPWLLPSLSHFPPNGKLPVHYLHRPYFKRCSALPPTQPFGFR